MAIDNAKILNVRIKNKYDSYENWAKSSIVLEAGEIAIAYTTVDVAVDNGTAKHPALLMKVGDGQNTFANLPWLSAKAADVLSVCKNENDLKTFVNNVIADAGIASDEAVNAINQKIDTMEDAIDALELLVGTTAVSQQISDAIAALNLADTYEAKGEAQKVQNALNAEIQRAEGIESGLRTDIDAINNTTTGILAQANAHTEQKVGTAVSELDTMIDTALGFDAKTATTSVKSMVEAVDAKAVANAGEITTIKGQVSALQQEDTRLGGLITDLTNNKADKTQVATDIADAVAAEAALREAADNALDGRITDLSGTHATDKAALEAAIALKADQTALDEVSTVANAAATKAELEAEEEARIAADNALDAKIKAISDDYLKAADKTELQGNIDTLTGVVETLRDGIDAEKVDGVKDLIAYVEEHGTEVTGMKEDIAKNAEDIEALSNSLTTSTDELKDYADDAAAAAQAAAEATAATDATTKADAAQAAAIAAAATDAANKANAAQAAAEATAAADATTKANAAEAAAKAHAETKASEAQAAAEKHADDAITALNIAQYAKQADLEALSATVNNKVDEADLAAIAKTGSTDDLVQGTKTLVFDCGTSAV